MIMANEQAGQKNKEVEVSPQPKGGQPLTADQLENSKKWSQLVAQAQADKKLKQRLMDNPASVLQEHGIEVPAGVEVRVVENTDQAPYMALEARLAGGATELTASHLSGVAGGVTERLSFSYTRIQWAYTQQ
jgi:hypothetical protein